MVYYTFDLFDTLFVRTFAKPTDLFIVLGENLKADQHINIDANDFAVLRIKAEQDARKKEVSGEITIGDIYDELINVLNIDAGAKEILILEEIKLERSSIKINERIKNIITKAQQHGIKIGYLSDMYLPAAVLRQWLNDFGLEEPWFLKVSGEEKINKHTGDLFRSVMKEFQLSPGQITHFGDNIHSDILMPRRLGISAVHITEANLNRYENELLRCKTGDSLIASAIAGTSRCVRLNSGDFAGPHKTVWDVSASVTAPLLFGFVNWVIEQAEKKGIQKLYFLARDGQILQKIAEKIVAARSIDISCKYLYASRQALHLPAVFEINETISDWVFDPTHFLSIRTIFNRLNAEPEEFTVELSAMGWGNLNVDENLLLQQRVEFKNSFFGYKNLLDTIIIKASQYRQNLIGYLEREEFFKSDDSAIVDIGWNGRLQRSLSLIVRNQGLRSKPVTGFYFQLYNRYKAFDDEEMYAYIESNKMVYNAGLLEIFVAADHGTTLHYNGIAQKNDPVLKNSINKKAINWGLKIQQDAVLLFVDFLLGNKNLKSLNNNTIKSGSLNSFNLFQTNPSKEEADVFGDYSFSEHQTDECHVKFADKYSLKDAFIKRIFGQSKFHGEWEQGVIIRSDTTVRFVLKNNSLPLRGFLKILRSVLKK